MTLDSWMIQIGTIIMGVVATYAVLRSRVTRLEEDSKTHNEEDRLYKKDLDSRMNTQFKRLDEALNRCTILEQNSTHHLDLNTAEEKFVSKKELDLRLQNIEIEARHTSKTVDKIEGKLEQVLYALSGAADEKLEK